MDNSNKKLGDYNHLPEYTFLITEELFWGNMLTYGLSTKFEYRQILVGDYTVYNFSLHKGLWETILYWIPNNWNPEHHIGVGMMKREDKIVYIKLGAKNHWEEYVINFSNQFANDRT